ncbi:hypothetical protein QQZ08_004430 [Neonectria magnoliae]|uniref:Bacteriophage T5 Orf172 DNA-binding domain-containing protein n=1 Tax=Neonectria magnoliae TaxID=2732573 RepID=A0ABR1I622_9HYPO
MSIDHVSTPIVLGKLISASVLDTRYTDPLKSDFKLCLGVIASGKRQCRKQRSWKHSEEATKLVEQFSKLDQCPHDDDFYADMRKFLMYTHCDIHIKEVEQKFMNWKRLRHKSFSTEPAEEEIDPESGQSMTIGTTSVGDHVAPHSDLPLFDFDQPEPSQPQISASTVNGLEKDFRDLAVTPTQTSVVSLAESSDVDATMIAPDLPSAEDISDSYQKPTPQKELVLISPPKGNTNPSEEETRRMEGEIEAEEDDPVVVARCKRRYTVNRSKSKLVHHINRRFDRDDKSPGIVYVLRHLGSDGCMKVGITRITDYLLEQIKESESCFAKDCEIVFQTKEKFPGASKVEKLVTETLRQNRHAVLECPYCDKTHAGWFQVTEAEVIAAIEAWTAFVTSPAYLDGTLSEIGHRMADWLVDLRPERVLQALDKSQDPVAPSVPEVELSESQAGISSNVPSDAKEMEDAKLPSLEDMIQQLLDEEDNGFTTKIPDFVITGEAKQSPPREVSTRWGSGRKSIGDSYPDLKGFFKPKSRKIRQSDSTSDVQSWREEVSIVFAGIFQQTNVKELGNVERSGKSPNGSQDTKLDQLRRIFSWSKLKSEVKIAK